MIIKHLASKKSAKKQKGRTFASPEAIQGQGCQMVCFQTKISKLG
jgi:hypothetical protein